MGDPGMLPKGTGIGDEKLLTSKKRGSCFIFLLDLKKEFDLSRSFCYPRLAPHEISSYQDQRKCDAIQHPCAARRRRYVFCIRRLRDAGRKGLW